MLKAKAITLAILVIAGSAGAAFAAPAAVEKMPRHHRHYVHVRTHETASIPGDLKWNLPDGWPRS